MYARTRRTLGSTTQQQASRWFPLPAVEIVVVCTVSSCSSEVDTLDGAAKGDGESDDNTDVMWVRGVWRVVVLSERKERSSKIVVTTHYMIRKQNISHLRASLLGCPRVRSGAMPGEEKQVRHMARGFGIGKRGQVLTI